MRTVVSGATCRERTRRAANAPDLFNLDDIDGHVLAVAAIVPHDRQIAVREAAQPFPEQAFPWISGRQP